MYACILRFCHILIHILNDFGSFCELLKFEVANETLPLHFTWFLGEFGLHADGRGKLTEWITVYTSH